MALKGQVESYLHAHVCDGRTSHGGQRVIALDCASFYNRNLKPRPKPATPASVTAGAIFAGR